VILLCFWKPWSRSCIVSGTSPPQRAAGVIAAYNWAIMSVKGNASSRCLDREISLYPVFLFSSLFVVVVLLFGLLVAPLAETYL